MNADQWYVSKSEKTEAIPRFRACVGLWNSEFGFAPSRCRFDESQQVRVSLDRFELRKLFPDVLRRAKQEADIRLPEHGGVIIGIAHSDDVVIQTSEGNDGFFLLIADAEPIIDDAIANNLQLMAKESGPFQISGVSTPSMSKVTIDCFTARVFQDSHDLSSGSEPRSRLLPSPWPFPAGRGDSEPRVVESRRAWIVLPAAQVSPVGEGLGQ